MSCRPPCWQPSHAGLITAIGRPLRALAASVHVRGLIMPFPKQAKAPKGAGAEAGAAGEDCCFFCKQQVDQDDEHIKGAR